MTQNSTFVDIAGRLFIPFAQFEKTLLKQFKNDMAL
jgi:hypothetical protein